MRGRHREASRSGVMTGEGGPGNEVGERDRWQVAGDFVGNSKDNEKDEDVGDILEGE